MWSRSNSECVLSRKSFRRMQAEPRRLLENFQEEAQTVTPSLNLNFISFPLFHEYFSCTELYMLFSWKILLCLLQAEVCLSFSFSLSHTQKHIHKTNLFSYKVVSYLLLSSLSSFLLLHINIMLDKTDFLSVCFLMQNQVIQLCSQDTENYYNSLIQLKNLKYQLKFRFTAQIAQFFLHQLTVEPKGIMKANVLKTCKISHTIPYFNIPARLQYTVK